MAIEDRPAAAGWDDLADTLPARLARALLTRGRPWLGWITFGLCVALALLPAYTLLANNWVRAPETATLLASTGALAVVCVWWAAGWARPARVARLRALAALYAALAVLLVGALVLSVQLAHWLPDGAGIWALLRHGDPGPAVSQMNDALTRYGARLMIWWVSAGSGSVVPDERVFALFAGVLIWCAAALAAALARRTRSALLAALPLLLTVGAVVFFGGKGRPIFIAALALVLALHVALDNQRLTETWQHVHADFNPELLGERWLNAAALAAVALLLAWFMPVFSISAVADFYARLLAPLDQRIESVRKQAFPNIETAPRYHIAGTTSGLPNDFLLGAGPELNQTRILELRTGDSPLTYDASPPAPYLRAQAFAHYTGLGWETDAEHTLLELPADTRRPNLTEQGRRLLAQTIRTYVPAQILFAAGEPAEASVPAWLRYDAQGQLASMTSSARAYTVLSLAPALGDDALRALPAWDTANPLPSGFAGFLNLPPTITQRTRTLAATVTRGISGPYAQATAIQDYLRAFPYSLDVAAPPPSVSDVTDYFLFDLKTGYCDYYATAFVVLARLNGLPARFVTGYAPGAWLPDARAWLISAAQSHAWPEVYFPAVGWIAFEPTANRSPIARTGSAVINPNAPLPPASAIAAETSPGIDWNPQMLVWLLPLALLAWGGWTVAQRIRRATQDPWRALQAWGTRAGRPPHPEETPLEYAAGVAGLAETFSARDPEHTRIAARETRALGQAVSAAQFAPVHERSAARAQARSIWQRLQPNLARLRPPRRASPL